MYTKILIPLDGSELAESVLPAVVEMAKTLGLEVILFRAYSVPSTVYAGTDGYSAMDFEALIAGVRRAKRATIWK